MTESIIAGTELKLTAHVTEDGVVAITWDKLPTQFLFHEGYAALLRLGSGETEGMVELVRVPVDMEREVSGHVEPLLSD